MSTINIRLPKSLHKAIRELAKEEQISVNQFVATALAEKISALMTEDYLMKRAERAPSREEFEAIMQKVPDVPADAEDQI